MSGSEHTSKLRYLGTLTVAQAPLLVTAVLAKTQIADRPITSAMLATAWLFVSGFAIRVWKEVEDDAVRGAANVLRAMPRKAADVAARGRDAIAGWLRAWSPGFTGRYLREVRRAYGLFNDKGLGLINANRLDLDKVYVDLKATGDVNLNQPNLNPVTREIHGRASFWEHLRTLRSGFALAIIGAPGCGKTTLLQHVLLTYARNRQWRKKMRGRVPFFIELRKVWRELAKDRPPPLPKILEKILKEDLYGLNVSFPKGWIEARIRSGRCILLWDGLDEVADVSQRQKVSAWLDQQIAQAAATGGISLVSARPAGYRAAPLERAHVLEVQPFDFHDTRRFIEQWCHANEVVSHGNRDNADVRARARRDAADLRGRLSDNPRLAVLTGNPLLLTMVCMVHRYHGALPGSRGQLYAEICQVLLERWRQTKGIADEHRGEQKLEVLRHLARHMMEQHIKELNTEETVRVITEPLSLLGVAKSEATSFLDRLQESSGLLLELTPGLWSFAHLSFQEYLCADLWAQRPDVAPTDWGSKVGDSWWRETLLLYATRASDASPIVSAALDAASPPALALALVVHAEKPSLSPTVRERLDQALTNALASTDKEIFQPAAEALLWHHHEGGFHLLNADNERQLSGWVSQAEYQQFLLSLEPRECSDYFPMHWKQEWFRGTGEQPIAGVRAKDGKRYCEWLNERFPEWSHSLPTPGDLATLANGCHSDGVLVPLTYYGWFTTPDVEGRIIESLDAWIKATGWNVPCRKVLQVFRVRVCERESDRARARNFIRNLNFVLAHDYAREFGHARAREYAHAQACDYDVRGGGARELGPDLARAIARALDRALALDLDLQPDPALDYALARALDRALDRDPDLNLALDYDYDYARARDYARASALSRDLARDFGDDFPPNLEIPFTGDAVSIFGQNVRRRWVELTNSSDPLIRRRAICLTALLPVLESESFVATASAWRRFFVAAFDAIRDHDPKLITKDLFSMEAYFRVTVARENGILSAWEGLRIVRQKRE